MRILHLMDRKLICVSLAVSLVVWAAGLLLVGANPSDTEMSVTFWIAFLAGFVVGMGIVGRDERRKR